MLCACAKHRQQDSASGRRVYTPSDLSPTPHRRGIPASRPLRLQAVQSWTACGVAQCAGGSKWAGYFVPIQQEAPVPIECVERSPCATPVEPSAVLRRDAHGAAPARSLPPILRILPMAREIVHHQRHQQEEAGPRPRRHQDIPIPQRMQLRPANDREQRGGPARRVDRARQ